MLEEFGTVVVGGGGVDGEEGDEVGLGEEVAALVDVAEVVGALTVVVEFGQEFEGHFEGEFP